MRKKTENLKDGNFYDASGQMIPFSNTLYVWPVEQYQYKEGLNEDGVRITYTIKVKVTAKTVSGYAAFSKSVNATVKVK